MSEVKECPTIKFDIYMAGDIDQAKQECREFCRSGLCVSVESVDYIYTGGEERGFKVGIINYPRFPSDANTLENKALELAERLRYRCCQHSFSVVGPDRTIWVSHREDGK